MIDEICLSLGWDKEKILGKDRHKDLCSQRRLICKYLLSHGFSYHQVGTIINRHHTTAVHYKNDLLTKEEQKMYETLLMKLDGQGKA